MASQLIGGLEMVWRLVKKKKKQCLPGTEGTVDASDWAGMCMYQVQLQVGNCKRIHASVM